MSAARQPVTGRTRDAVILVDKGIFKLAKHWLALLNFWATWCPPCKEEIPAIERAYQAHRDDGFMVLGVNEGEALDLVQAFAGELGITYPVLIDRRGDVAAQYRRRGLPLTLIVDRKGLIQVRHEGYLAAGQLDKYLSGLLP